MGQAKVTHINVDDHDFKSVISRHRSFWERGEEDSFLFSAGPASTPAHLPLRQADGSYLSRAERLTPDMVDVSALVDEVERLRGQP